MTKTRQTPAENPKQLTTDKHHNQYQSNNKSTDKQITRNKKTRQPTNHVACVLCCLFRFHSTQLTKSQSALVPVRETSCTCHSEYELEMRSCPEENAIRPEGGNATSPTAPPANHERDLLPMGVGNSITRTPKHVVNKMVFVCVRACRSVSTYTYAKEYGQQQTLANSHVHTHEHTRTHTHTHTYTHTHTHAHTTTHT